MCEARKGAQVGLSIAVWGKGNMTQWQCVAAGKTVPVGMGQK